MSFDGTKVGADPALRLKIIAFLDALQHSGVELSFTMNGMEFKQITNDPTVIALPNLYRNVVPINRRSESASFPGGAAGFEQYERKSATL